jgi:DNA-binding IscR family transcriptional regulator
VTVKDVLDASEHGTFEVNCECHQVDSERCTGENSCAIRPVWQLLQQRIDETLGAIHLADLLHEESEVRTLVGLNAVVV